VVNHPRYSWSDWGGSPRHMNAMPRSPNLISEFVRAV
jgi:hypothetical protein